MNPSATLTERDHPTKTKNSSTTQVQQSHLQNSTELSSSRNERNELYLAARAFFSLGRRLFFLLVLCCARVFF
jgi:hypothetical protein